MFGGHRLLSWIVSSGKKVAQTHELLLFVGAPAKGVLYPDKQALWQ